jgi:hypothetical protein
MGVPAPPLLIDLLGELIVGEVRLEVDHGCGDSTPQDAQSSRLKALKSLPSAVGDAQSAWRGALDEKESFMHQSVATNAQGREIRGHGRASCAPKADVMHVKIDGAATNQTTVAVARQDAATKTLRGWSILPEGKWIG